MASSPDEVLIRVGQAVRVGNLPLAAAGAKARANHLRKLGRDDKADRMDAAFKFGGGLPSQANGLLDHEAETGVAPADVVLSRANAAVVDTVARTFAARDRLAKHGLAPVHRLLLVGPPGTGKTTLARALATMLELPLVTLSPSILGSLLGESMSRIDKAFGFVRTIPCVFFVDEVDGLAASRGGGDVGEMRRVLLTLLRLVEDIPGHVVFVAATNREEDIDAAMPRRFDATLRFSAEPSGDDLAQMRRILERRHGVDPGPLSGTNLALAARAGLARIRKIVMKDGR